MAKGKKPKKILIAKVVEEPIINTGTEYIVEYWDMSERPWKVVYKGFDRVKAAIKYNAYKKSYVHTRKNF